jgi:hypothetical protein
MSRKKISVTNVVEASRQQMHSLLGDGVIESAQAEVNPKRLRPPFMDEAEWEAYKKEVKAWKAARKAARLAHKSVEVEVPLF